MADFLRQSTAATKKMGPFLDEDDGKTTEEALTISQADIRLTKNGGAFAQSNNAAGGTHDENGYYGIPLDTTDSGTLGSLRVAIHEAGALPVWKDFMVVPANVYDSMFSTDKLEVDAVQISASVDLIDRPHVAGLYASFAGVWFSRGRLATYTANDYSGSSLGLRAQLRARSGTAMARLWDVTADEPVEGSQLSTSSSAFVVQTSSALSLVDAHVYQAQIGKTSGATGEFDGIILAKL